MQPGIVEGGLMGFQVSGLEYAQFAPLFALSDAELAERSIVRRVADAKPGFPCRVSLEDAEPGETLLLLNYEHLGVASPYRACHAIYVRENAKRATPERGEIPEVLAKRLLSMRAYDRTGMMVEADVVQGREAAPLIERMLANPNVAFLHAHNAKPGCFAACNAKPRLSITGSKSSSTPEAANCRSSSFSRTVLRRKFSRSATARR